MYLWSTHWRVVAWVWALLHGHCLAHVWSAWDRVGQSWTAGSLVWGVRVVLWHWASLWLEWWRHSTTASTWTTAESWTTLWRVAHLLALVLWVEATSTTVLSSETASAFAVLRLGGFTAQVAGGGARSRT
jgi:hypothetical protein